MRARWVEWSLRRRIVLASAIGLASLLILGTAAFSWALARILIQTSTDEARARASQVAARLQDGATPAAAIEALGGQRLIVQVTDASGLLVLATSQDDLDEPVIRRPTPAPGQEQVHRVFGISDEQDPFLVVEQGVTTPSGAAYTVIAAAELRVETRTVATSTALLAGGAVLLGGLLLVWVDRIVLGALAPVERITTEVSRISRLGGGQRVTVPVAQDEIAALAETMNAMLERVARADVATRRFVSDASHELRSPIATLRLHVETADDSGVDLDLMKREIMRLQVLVDDLLTLAKADDRGLQIRAEEVDLDDVVDTEVRRLRAVSAGPVRAHVEPALVQGDANRLAQVIRNVIENAVRHTTGEVAVLMELQPDVVRVHVDNDGPPIPPEMRRAVFERFVRLDDDRGRGSGGSGLGLAIARAFTDAHGGSLTMGVSPSGGCRCTLALPRIVDEDLAESGAPQGQSEAEGPLPQDSTVRSE